MRLSITLLLLFICSGVTAQLPFNLVDGRQDGVCISCKNIINQKPKEVLFGLDIHDNWDIYFSITNNEWFDKIISSDAYGIMVDIVSEDRYPCGGTQPVHFSETIPRGTMLSPVYRKELVKGKDAIYPGSIYVKIGKVPVGLRKKKLECNLIIVHRNAICYYTNFVNIDRNPWQLLPMGLFTDSLLYDTKGAATADTITPFFTYTKKIQLEVPFERAGSKADSRHLKALYDSIQLSRYSIRKVELRAYSSVEGPLLLNRQLMKKRADTILKALKKYDVALNRVDVITAENWLEFFKDIDTTKFKELGKSSKEKIKQRLTDQLFRAEMEPLLSRHRKAVITLFLEERSLASGINDKLILNQFYIEVGRKSLDTARAILKEMVGRIMDNRLPSNYIDRLEVPREKAYATLLNDIEVYRYLLYRTTEYAALQNMLEIQKLDPRNGRLNYNICALRFFAWRYGDVQIAKPALWNDISALSGQGINEVLVKRMQVNYHILKSEQDMGLFNYAGKDSSVAFVREAFRDINLDDADIYSLAKYFNYYSFPDWALQVITPRIDKIDVSEDLVFYYLNLLFFHPHLYGTDLFRSSMLNAVNLNRPRFCNFFLPHDRGGASMQLLENEMLMSKYCEECK